MEKEWVVLRVSPEPVVLRFCLFNLTNAKNNKCFYEAWTARASLAGFEAMFADEANWSPRRNQRALLNLTPAHPTDPQAEVLAFDPVPPDAIMSVNFKDLPTKRAWGDAHPELLEKWAPKFLVERNLFKPRPDYEAWSKDVDAQTEQGAP